MKFAMSVAILALLLGTAEAKNGGIGGYKFRVADATSDACFASCSSQSESCKRVCPSTLGAPCVSSCESQAQTCRQGCQSNR